MREKRLSSSKRFLAGTALIIAGAAAYPGCVPMDEPAHPKAVAAVAASQVAPSPPKPKDAKAIIEALRNGTLGNVNKAIADLVSIGKPAVPGLIGFLKTPFPSKADRSARGFAVDALLKMGIDKDALLEMFTDVLKTGNPGERAAAAVVLGKLEDKKAIPALMEALKDGVEFVDEALNSIGVDEKLLDEIIAILKSWNTPRGRAAAAGALSWGENPKIFTALAAALNDPEEVVRVAAVNAIGVTPKAIPMLAKALKDGSPKVRLAAVESLAAIEDKSVLPLLRNASKNDADKKVRDAAVNALESLNDDVPGNAELRKEIDALVKALRSPKVDARRKAAEELSQLEIEPSSKVQPGQPAVDGMIRSLGDSDREVRRLIAIALGQLGGKRALPALNKVRINDYHKAVRDAAAEAMEWILTLDEKEEGEGKIPLKDGESR